MAHRNGRPHAPNGVRAQGLYALNGNIPHDTPKRAPLRRTCSPQPRMRKQGKPMAHYFYRIQGAIRTRRAIAVYRVRAAWKR